MKKIDLFMIRSFIGPMILTFFIVLIIFILQFLWMYIDELAGKGLEPNVLAELLFQFTLTFVPLSLPLAILLASLMTFGNLGEYLELTAFKSSGVPLERIMLPVFVFATLLSIGSFLFADYVLPVSTRKARSLLYDIRRKRPEFDIQAGTFYNRIDGFSIKVTEIEPKTNRLDGIYIYDHREGPGSTSVIHADSGYMKVTNDESGLILTLYNGFSYKDIDEKNVPQNKRKYPFRRDKFSEQTMVIELTGFGFDRSGMNLYRSNYATLNRASLRYYVDSLSSRYNTRSNECMNEFIKNKLFSSSEIYSGRKHTYGDTAVINNLANFNCKAAFDTLTFQDKSTAIGTALNFAREGSSFLTEKSESLKAEAKNLRKYEAEQYKRYTLPFACLVFFFIGAPLGAIIRKGGLGTPAVISVLFFVVYYVISLSGEKFAKELIISLPLGMLSSTILLLLLGIFLTYKATTDSSLMNTETYMLFFRKIGTFFTGTKPEKDNENSGTVT